MGWPFETADWATVEGAMYMGAGGGMPGFWTLVAAVICVAVLAIGNLSEHQKYKDAEK